VSRSALVDFQNVQPRVKKLLNIEQFFSTENSFELKVNIIWEFGCTLNIVTKPSMSRI
jgi:hypothetical protein